MEFSVIKHSPTAGWSLANNPDKILQSHLDMPLIYAAYGKPRKIWRFNIPRLIAFFAITKTPWDFARSQMRAEEYVDFAVAEAETLARCYELQIQVIYHGDPFYARKYKPLQLRQQQQR